MADYPALRAAIDADPENASRDDAAVADALNVPVPGAKRLIPVRDIWRLALSRGRTPQIRRAAAVAGPAQDVAQAAMDLFTVDLVESVDTSEPVFLAVLDGLVNAELIAQQDRSDILALADTTTSRAIQVFGHPVSEHDVAYARSL